MQVYFHRKNPQNYQVFPIPENLENFINIEVESISALEGKELVFVNNEYKLVSKRPTNNHKWNGQEWVIDEEDQMRQFTEHKTQLIARLAAKADSFKDTLLVGYPQAEIESFYRQEKEALAYSADPQAQTPMLRQIAEQRGVPFDVLVQKVIEKSNQFAVAVGVIIGQRQKFEDRILTAKNEEQLTEIESEVQVWQFNLAS